MSKIQINTDGHTSNYDAISAVGRLMVDNYRQRSYMADREYRMDSGAEVIVRELPKPEGGGPCDGCFEVTKNTRPKHLAI